MYAIILLIAARLKGEHWKDMVFKGISTQIIIHLTWATVALQVLNVASEYWNCVLCRVALYIQRYVLYIEKTKYDLCSRK